MRYENIHLVPAGQIPVSGTFTQSNCTYKADSVSAFPPHPKPDMDQLSPSET